MRPLTLIALLAGSVSAASAEPVDLTADLRDLHLQVEPRTQAEQARIQGVLATPSDFTAPEAFEGKPGGATTVEPLRSRDPFSEPSGNLTSDQQLDFRLGEALFDKLWVSSPASTKASDGLGPLYNARSCLRCHIKDGRGHPPENDKDNRVSMFLRLSVPAHDAPLTQIETYLAGLGDTTPRTRPDPNYGGQLQDFAMIGHVPEAQWRVTYREEQIALSGGETASLRHPTYQIRDHAYGPMQPDVMVSPRVAPQMIGLGLIEAISSADILAHADPSDSDEDGISGRAQVVWSHEFDAPMLGRFGYKGGNPTLHQQSAGAFRGDIGISSPLFPQPAGDCMAAQTACLKGPHGDQDARVHEIDQQAMDLVTFYTRNLAVPARRDLTDPQVLRGKELFHDTGCASCHRPKYVTQRLSDQPAQSFQLIWPYSDFLLHDMGPALADNRPEGRASGQEWKTPPLWGIGLTQQVSGHSYFLHDGRARSLLEAVLWHGGEAGPAKDRVVAMPPPDRAALIRFLESL